jgi:3',5'-cyclic AMP phosphodiesterase CpdA
MFVLAHLSDPHLGPLPAARLGDFIGKRAIGYLNWHRNRTGRHRGDALATLVADLKAQTPSHIAVTGDLINLALPAEFAPARAWLDTLGPADDVSLVPGNHDAYAPRTGRYRWRLWGDFMRSDGADRQEIIGRASFPFLRIRNGVALIGLSSAVPTPALMATGRLGLDQRDRLAVMLHELGRQGLFRVVMIHHPPRTPRTYRHKRLTDGRGFRDILARHGAELVVHGHDHVPSLVWLDGPHRPIPAFGVPSASAHPDRAKSPAAYNLYRIEGTPGSWHCEAITRGFNRSAEIGEVARKAIA